MSGDPTAHVLCVDCNGNGCGYCRGYGELWPGGEPLSRFPCGSGSRGMAPPIHGARSPNGARNGLTADPDAGEDGTVPDPWLDADVAWPGMDPAEWATEPAPF